MSRPGWKGWRSWTNSVIRSKLGGWMIWMGLLLEEYVMVEGIPFIGRHCCFGWGETWLHIEWNYATKLGILKWFEIFLGNCKLLSLNEKHSASLPGHAPARLSWSRSPPAFGTSFPAKKIDLTKTVGHGRRFSLRGGAQKVSSDRGFFSNPTNWT